MAQNYAPHLLLQNFHGNGYPPVNQQNIKSPQSNLSAAQPQVGQSSIKTTQSRRKTPQIHTAGPLQPKLSNAANQHLSQTPNSQVKPGSLQNSTNTNNNYVSNYSNNLGGKQFMQNQQQFPLSTKNAQNSTNYQQFGPGTSSGLAPIPIDSSLIDYQDDVMDISNNTIANINQQLGGSKTQIPSQSAQTQMAQPNQQLRKKSRGGGTKKRSVV